MVKILKNVCPYGGELTDVTVKDGRIFAIGKTNAEGKDCNGAYLFPGLIDIHSHGCNGKDTMDGREAIAEILKFQKAHGVTTYYPTTMTVPFEEIKKITNAPLCEIEDGAHHLGFHMEGPYFSAKYKGAQNEKFLRLPDHSDFSTLLNISILSIAPELEGSEEFIRASKNTVISLGHTDADFEIADAAFRAGASCITHTCNAMPPLHHREPSVIGAGIENDAYAQVICDGLHIKKPMITALYRIFGRRRMILISDSMSATGLGDGTYEFGGQMISVKDGVARTEGGALAGSTATLYDCVKKAIEFGIPPTDAFAMASETPATLMGLNKGKLEVGYDADFILTDEKYGLLDTLIL